MYRLWMSYTLRWIRRRAAASALTCLAAISCLGDRPDFPNGDPTNSEDEAGGTVDGGAEPGTVAPGDATAPAQSDSTTGDSMTDNSKTPVVSTKCTPNQYESTSAAEDTDVQCAELTVCEPGTYISRQAEASQDRECSACASGSFSTQNNAAFCTPATECQPNEYQASPPTATQDATCLPLSVCGAGFFEQTSPESDEDRICAPCPSGEFSSIANASACTPWSVCLVGETESVAPSAGQDRVCSTCASGEYESNGICTPLTVCSDDQFQSVAPSSNSDRECASITDCLAGELETGAPSQFNDRSCAPCSTGFTTTKNETQCTAWRTCDAGSYVVPGTGTSTSDRTCNTCTTGFTSEQNETSCTEWTTCTWPMGGQVQAGTAISDAICGSASAYRQFGTTSADFGESVAVDGNGNVFVVGYTQGALAASNTASEAAFIRKYDLNGTEVWTKQFGTSTGTRAFAVAADGSGSSYVAGFTAGVLDGNNAGAVDAFVFKYDADGEVTWTRQWGTSSSDYARGVAVDTSGNVYVTGQTGGALENNTSAGGNDAYLRKYNSGGMEQWTRQWGTSSTDNGSGVAVNPGGLIYVVGETGSDAEIRTFTSTGSSGWFKTITTAGGEDARDVAVTGNGDAYVTGYTSGSLTGTNAGGSDVYVRKYLVDGNISWTRQFGTTGSDYGTALAADGSGNLYVAGYTAGAITGTNEGQNDIFVRKYGPTGSITWTRQMGTSGSDSGSGLAVDGSENVYISGSTSGAFAGAGLGSWDIYIGQLTQ